MFALPPALAPLAAYRQFILYRLDRDPIVQGKTHKRPIDPRTLRVPRKGTGGAHDPAMWTDAATALHILQQINRRDYGLGFVFTAADPFFFFDVDNCITATGWSNVANWLCQTLAGAAVEVSQSGRGLHIIGTGNPGPHGCKSDHGFDLYTEGRFVALTGTHATGDVRADLTHSLPGVLPYLTRPAVDLSSAEWTDEPVPSYGGPADNPALLNVMMRATSAAAKFGGATTATFAQLWTADADALGTYYPDDQGQQGRAYDGNRADQALAQHLAYWTGNNCERIEELMRLSALARDKWDMRPDYLERTILNAVSKQTRWPEKREPQQTVLPGTLPLQAVPELVATMGVPEAPGDAPAAASELPEQYCSIQRQLELFNGFTYVEQEHAILVGNGRVLKPEQFRVLFGGYSFQLDPMNQKIARNAWEAFTESQLHRFPRAERTCFRPDEQPNAIVEHGGERMVNLWAPIVVPRSAGDVSLFLRHLEILLPVPADRDILLAYLAAVVQHPGVKFQWCPLIQGVPGNGKTLFTRCVSQAVGQRYVHMPRSSEFVEGKFNDWLFAKIFIGVEDIYVPDKNESVLEALKPMITGEWQEIEGKGIKKAHREVCANFMLNCNKKSGLRKAADDRRLSIFYTAQQTPEDLKRDGLNREYFDTLYGWLRAGGYAMVNDFLLSYAIPHALNPARGGTAPETSSTLDAIEIGRGRFEQELLERVERGTVGFAGGWLSSTYVSALANELRITLPPRRMPEVLATLGYVHHPALGRDGRCTAIVAPDSCKPRLYVKRDHPAAQLPHAQLAMAKYTEAQMAVSGLAPAAMMAASN